MRYRVKSPRVLEGYEKASFQYDAGDIVEDGITPAEHIARLLATDALEPIDAEPAAKPAGK